jgi:hypothetical protein
MGDFATPIPASGTVDRDALVAMLNAHEGLAGLAGAVVQLASGSTVSIAAGTADTRREIEITGTTGISSFGAGAAGEVRVLRFVSAGCVVNHSSAIVCPGAANITSEAGTVLKVWKLASGSDWLVFDVWHPSVLAGVSIGLPPGHISGLGLANNSTDAANDLDIAAGRARSDDDTANIVLPTLLVKRLDANWSAGTNQGGLDTGSKANSTTYHVFGIGDGAGTVDVLFSASLASPTLPGGYTKKRRLGSIITDGSGNIRAFSQNGNRFQLATAVQDFNDTTIGTSRSLLALTVPAGLAVEAVLRSYSSVAGANVLILTDPAETDAAPSLSAAPGHTFNGAGQNFQGLVGTNTSRQIAARSNAAGQLLRVWTYGWIDRRGRDA